MIHPILAQTRAQAITYGIRAVKLHGDDANVVLSIEEPWVQNGAEHQLHEALDRHYLAVTRGGEATPQDAVSTVADTIFPAGHLAKHGPEEFYDAYLEDLPQIRSLPGGIKWGTYAERLFAFPPFAAGDGAGKSPGPFNQVTALIKRLRRAASGGQAWKNCYELNVHCPGIDARPRGGPCMSHLSFKPLGGKLHLTAMYRHHDYRFKLAGNLLGLARLQDFVASQTGLDAGSLTIHSVSAYIDREHAQLSGFWKIIDEGLP